MTRIKSQMVMFEQCNVPFEWNKISMCQPLCGLSECSTIRHISNASNICRLNGVTCRLNETKYPRVKNCTVRHDVDLTHILCVLLGVIRKE